MKGLDIGTMHLVKSELDEVVSEPVFTLERNVFLESGNTTDAEEALKENNWYYAKHDGKHYILGEDAIKLRSLVPVGKGADNQAIIATKFGELRRPMKDGILNTGEEKLSIAIIQKLIEKLVGRAKKPNEVLCFCAPADAADTKVSALFHKTILSGFIKSLGYQPECIPEALAIIFAERPVIEDPNEPNGESPFSGIAISFGAGMANIVFALKKLPLISFSVARSGDFIDKEAAKTAGIDQTAMMRFKEKSLNFDKLDYSDIRQAALDIFYQHTIEHVLTTFAEKFNSLDNKIDYPLDIILAGGTACVPGFLNKFKSTLATLDLPFKVKEVRMAQNPLYTVAHGCLIKAISVESKQTK